VSPDVPVTDLEDLLRAQPAVILDGGLGTELEHAGLDLTDPLWSARVLWEQPEAIRAVHRAFLEAGADVIITASYQATYPGFAARGHALPEITALLQRSVTLAAEERDAFFAAVTDPGRARPLVAASVGPYGAYLADGSEYRGGYGRTVAELMTFHRPRIEALLAAKPDLLACETVPCPQEAEALVRLLEEFPAARAWIAFSGRDGVHVSQGEPFAECAALAAASPQVVAVGVNCTAPQHVASLLRSAAAVVRDTPLVAYPNSSEVWDAETKRWRPGDARVADLAALARTWYDAGARLIGGCCRTRPADIRRIRSALFAEDLQ